MTVLGLTRSDAPALIEADSGETTSYRELLARADDVARGLGDGKRLGFLLCRNDTFSAIVYAAALRAGHAIALLDGSVPMGSHLPVLAAYRPDWVAGPDGTGAALEAEGLAPGEVEQLAGGELTSGLFVDEAVIHPELAVLLSTSGTTGSSKHVRLSAANVEANAASIARYIEIGPDERPITSLPLHYSFGLSVLNSHWLAGAAVVLSTASVMQRPLWESIRQRLHQLRGGALHLSDAGARRLSRHGPALDQDHAAGRWRPRPEPDRHLRRSHASRDGSFFVMYGQTEATARIAYVPPDRLPRRSVPPASPSRVGSYASRPGGRTSDGPAAARWSTRAPT